MCMFRVGQNHTFIGIYGVYIWYFWQENHQIYVHIRCIYTVLANPRYACLQYQPKQSETICMLRLVILSNVC